PRLIARSRDPYNSCGPALRSPASWNFRAAHKTGTSCRIPAIERHRARSALRAANRYRGYLAAVAESHAPLRFRYAGQPDAPVNTDLAILAACTRNSGIAIASQKLALSIGPI